MESLLHVFLRDQGYALFHANANGTFTSLFRVPQWCVDIWGLGAEGHKPLKLGEASPFLEDFLAEAREFWKSDAEEVCASGTWMETPPGRKEVPLEALALRLNGEPLLCIHSPQKEFQEQTQVFQTARESKLAHERLLKEIQKKEILLHCIIHDLSQPLAAIRGCFECLAVEAGAGQAKRFIDIGRQQTERQEAMIREVLRTFAEDLKAEMESGRAGGDVPDLLVCARDTIAAFSPVFEAKGATIELSVRSDVDADWKVAGEESRLKRVFSNLVENALRYAPGNSKVTIGMEQDGSFLRALVDDEGPGLPDGATAATIFSLLSKGKEGSGKAGLGLYFCKITVERWGGTIGCESRGDKGARFWFRLPRRGTTADVAGTAGTTEKLAASDSRRLRAPAVEAAATQASAARTEKRKAQLRRDGSRLRILLAEDQEDLRQLTAHLLKREGHRVLAVGNGRQALRALDSQRVDVVLLDEEMPEMSGTETVRRLRERERATGGHQLALALTGNATEADQQRLLDAGMDGCLAKPFYAAELRRALSEAEALKRTSTEHATPSNANIAGAGLLARVGGDAKLLQKIIRTFRKGSVKKLSEMKRALARKDGMALATAAHALKGSTSIFSSEGATQCAQKLQEMGRSEDLTNVAPTLNQLEVEIARLHEELRGYGRAERPKRTQTVRRKPRTRRAKRKR
jgi:signal transduction histidine kinase/response regulator RpfG family c-di-GMP phosphodiesterase